MKTRFLTLKIICPLCMVFINIGVLSAQVTLWAKDANISGKLKFHDPKTPQTTIHGWHNVEDCITWNQVFEQGNYLVRLHYAEPYTGAAISVRVGEQQFSTLIEPTESWTDYRTADLGVVRIPTTGNLTVTLQGIQLALKEDIFEEALPDVHWISLTPTTTKAITATQVGIPQPFLGIPLFDGETLNGWRGNDGENTLAWFRVEDGAIVGGNMEKNTPRNEFLSTNKEYTDFDLRLEFKLKFPPGKGWNAGIQFHSQRHPNIPYEMIGYQADIINRIWGAIYDESRRRKFLGTQLNPNPTRNPKEWTQLIVRCEGARIRIWVNGQQTLDYIEPYAYVPHPKHGIIPLKGYIALQVHEAKNPFEVWYRNIELQEL